MEIHFLGVGEACDGRQPNTSLLLKADSKESTGRVLLDCGFSVPHQYLSLNPAPEELETIWISHFHGDHFLGMPLLLLWFWEMNRAQPLNIVGPPDISNKIEQSLDLAYPNLIPRLGYPLLFQELRPGEQLSLSGFKWGAAYSEHSQPCLSLRLDLKDKSMFYSGDGRSTAMTGALAAGCNIIIHEAYGSEDSVPGHGSIRACLELARNAGVKRLALVHMQREVRLQCSLMLDNFQSEFPDIEVIVPEKGGIITL